MVSPPQFKLWCACECVLLVIHSCIILIPICANHFFLGLCKLISPWVQLFEQSHWKVWHSPFALVHEAKKCVWGFQIFWNTPHERFNPIPCEKALGHITINVNFQNTLLPTIMLTQHVVKCDCFLYVKKRLRVIAISW